MPRLYESILKKISEAQKLLDESKRNLSNIGDFVSKEMVHEPELAVKMLYAQVYNAVHKTL